MAKKPAKKPNIADYDITSIDQPARDAMLALLPIIKSNVWPVDTRDVIAKIEALKE